MYQIKSREEKKKSQVSYVTINHLRDFEELVLKFQGASYSPNYKMMIQDPYLIQTLPNIN